MSRNYWLDLFTGKTWEEFLKSGANVSGFRESRKTTCERIQPGDYLICYVTGISRFIGTLEVLSQSYSDHENRIWEDDYFPIRFRVSVIQKLNAKTAVPVLLLRDRLSIFKILKTPSLWQGFFRGSPTKFNPNDAKIVIEAIKEAVQNPIEREYDEKKYWRKAAVYPPVVKPVIVPGSDTEEIKAEPSQVTTVAPGRLAGDESRHKELQRKIREIGEILEKYATKEYHSAPYSYDVIWKDAEGLPRPTHVFEVQDKGAVDSALAKLQHARDIWRPRLFLVITGEKDKRKVDILLKPFLEGTFHGISKYTDVLTSEVIDEIHQSFSEHGEVIRRFVEE